MAETDAVLAKTRLTAAQRSLRGRIGAYAQHAMYSTLETTAAARAAALARFDDQVDPERKLPANERGRRAESARRSYFAGLALRSALARSTRNGPRGGSREPSEKGAADAAAARPVQV